MRTYTRSDVLFFLVRVDVLYVRGGNQSQVVGYQRVEIGSRWVGMTGMFCVSLFRK